jgi:hypothetical protein
MHLMANAAVTVHEAMAEGHYHYRNITCSD